MKDGFERPGTSDLTQALRVDDKQLKNVAKRSPGRTSQKPNHLIAQEAGISERHLYRLRKKPTGEHDKLPLNSCSGRVAAQLLTNLGHCELLGTPAHKYLDSFIAEFVSLLSTHVQADEIDIDIRWAKCNARQVVESVQAAAQRRREKIEQLIDADA